MFTVCPKCALTLVVTAADLRVAQGYVRCGRCSNVFNALARLSEDRQSAIAAAQAAAAPQPAPLSRSPPAPAPAPPDSVQAEIDDDEPIPEAALEFNPAAADASKVFVAAPPNPEWTAATGSFKAIVLKNEEAAKAVGRQGAPEPQGEIELDADFLSATAAMRNLKMAADAARLEATEDNTARAADARPTGARPVEPEPRRVDQPPRQVPPAKSILPTQNAPPKRSAPPPKAATESRVALGPQARSSATPFAFNMESPPAASAEVARSRIAPGELGAARTLTSPGSATLWSVGTGALVILLAAQIVNHYRNDLAANAQLNRPITALYAAFGVPLTPRWDLHAYDVRQLGASVDSASSGQIMVRASVKNGAHQAQPMPLLRVTLQDRFGNRIAARDVAPQNYLPRAIPASSYLSAGQRIDAEMAFVDPGSNAVGFEIDACLPAPAGGTACANDPAAR
jgi:predicted Zn finger-like uncharacterized protein